MGALSTSSRGRVGPRGGLKKTGTVTILYNWGKRRLPPIDKEGGETLTFTQMLNTGRIVSKGGSKSKGLMVKCRKTHLHRKNKFGAEDAAKRGSMRTLQKWCRESGREGAFLTQAGQSTWGGSTSIKFPSRIQTGRFHGFPKGGKNDLLALQFSSPKDVNRK